jgi:mannan endo-1,4-beta-mannosidase
MRNKLNPESGVRNPESKTKRTIITALLLFLMPVIVSAYTVRGANIMNDAGAAVKIVAVDVPYLLALNNEEAGKILASLSAAGIKTVRILGSYTGDGEYSFQTKAGVYNKKMFEKMDGIIAAAGKNGVSLVIALSDSNPDFGGKEVYKEWTGASSDDVFFKDRISMEYFKKYMNEFLSRKNTVSGRLYAADPAIMAWDLCNAAENNNDPDGTVMLAWVKEMAAFVKSKDKKHLVTISVKKPDTAAGKINDFELAMIPEIDFISFGMNAADAPAEAGRLSALYCDNTSKPAGAFIYGGPVNITASAAAFFGGKGALLAFNYAGFGGYSAKDGAINFEDAEVLKSVKEAAVAAGAGAKITGLSMSKISASPSTDSAVINITLGEKAEAEVMYGTAIPLLNSTGLASLAAGAGKIKIEGLEPATKYLYIVKAKSGEKAAITEAGKFTTIPLTRLKAVPFTASKNFIKAKGTGFYDGDRKYKYLGANNYYIRHKVAADKPLVDEIYRQAAAVGIKVIRIGSNGEAVDMDSIDKKDINRFFRIGPDFFNEAAYREFDYVMDSAARHNIRVIIHFTDNWEYYGGAKVYVKWAGQTNKNIFWTDAKCKEYYKQTIDAFVNRKNTVNGKLYKNDPAIFAFDLMNEPRDEDDLTGKTLAAWVDEMSTYIKSIDSNHMVTTGTEGFFLKDDGTHYSGADFVMLHKPKNIDFCTFHIYPASQYNNFSPSTTKWQIDNYIKVGHETVGKPVVMEEYGIPNKMPEFPKAKWIKDMTEEFFATGGDGGNYLFFIDPSYTYGDGNEVVYNQTEYMNTFIKISNDLNKNGY